MAIHSFNNDCCGEAHWSMLTKQRIVWMATKSKFFNHIIISLRNFLFFLKMIAFQEITTGTKLPLKYIQLMILVLFIRRFFIWRSKNMRHFGITKSWKISCSVLFCFVVVFLGGGGGGGHPVCIYLLPWLWQVCNFPFLYSTLESPVFCILNCWIHVLRCSRVKILWSSVTYKTYDKANINCKNMAIEAGLIQLFGTSAVLFYWFLLLFFLLLLFFFFF